MVQYDEFGNSIGEYPDPIPISPATQAAPASPTPRKPLYTPRGDASEFEGEKYEIKNHTYPSDLYSNRGSYGGNYAIFYINVSTDSKLIKEDKAETVNDFTPGDRGDFVGMDISANELIAGNAVATGTEGAIAGGLFTGNVAGAAKGFVGGAATGAAVGFLVGSQGTRQQKRLKTAIALHIPNNLSINYSVAWSEEDTAGLAMGVAAAREGWEIAKAITGKGNNSDVTGTGAAILTNLALTKGPNASGNSVATGLAANPKKEQVFKGVNFRTFTFDYKFFPRNSQESRDVMNIIKTFKYHMHPEFKDNNNFVYIYPSEFDIFYYNDGQENLNLHRHTSCVLTDMSVNYAPNGSFSTYYDGMPTQIDITLSFRELALLTKEKVKDGL
jgi:hypothetical protein